ncbi:MAG: hypothetical protein QMC93_00935 [Patescibacteria group bacterium]|nr:hypothetical protein [Patescibacteria group bacterium]
MNLKYILIIVILAALVGGGILTYQYCLAPKEEIKLPEEVATDETADWKTYRNNGIGIQFKYPGNGEIENTTFIDKQIGPIYVKAFPIGIWGPYTINPYEGESEMEKQKNEKYYKDLFLSIKDYPQNQECNNLDTYIPIFGKSNLDKSCRMVNSDSGVKIITGFYMNIHGEPPKVAFFITDKYWIELLLYYYNGEPTSFGLNSDSFVQEIQLGKYENISRQIDVFDRILKTVEVIE